MSAPLPIETPVRTFPQAVAFLEAGINYEKTAAWNYDRRWLNLDRVRALMNAFGAPHRRGHVIHVAGTKGKGSTAHAAARCLTHCGLCTGLLTSPHLTTARERIRVDGRMIGEDDFTRLVGTIQPYVEERRRRGADGSHEAPTYFEMLTAVAFIHFAEREVDWTVAEVGLGGRLDSTNVVMPACCVFTAIGFDHTDKLGDTIEAIATEKAGILKERVPVVIGAQRYGEALATLRRAVEAHHCPKWEVGRDIRVSDAEPLSAPAGAPDGPVGWRFSLSTPAWRYDGLSTMLPGAHQLENLAAAVGAVELAAEKVGFEPDRAAIASAVAGLRMPGRLEVLQRLPALVLDVAHTVESVEALLAALDTHFPGRAVHVLFGCSQNKDLPGMLGAFRGKCASFTAIQASLPRAMPAEEVLAAARECGVSPPDEMRLIRDPWEAVTEALSRAGREDVLCMTGSFFTAGEVRARWQELHPDLEG